MHVQLASSTAPSRQLASARPPARVPLAPVPEPGEAGRLALLARQANAARDTTILSLASLAEQRDITTGSHLQRIETYVTLLAEWVVANRREALPEHARDPETIGRCAMLHDIGKVGIPDSVLLKRGAFDKADRRIMRRHPSLGAEILDRVLAHQPGSAFLRIARDIIACHHEAYDGSGYPHGLPGSRTPLVAQIATVADVFDALTSERPYKPAHATRDALAWIEERAGRQFAPLVVEALRARADQFAAVRERLGDRPSEAPIAPSGMKLARGGAPRALSGRPVAALDRALREALSSRTGGEVLVRSGDVVGRIHVREGRVAWVSSSGEPSGPAEGPAAPGQLSTDDFRSLLRDQVAARLADLQRLSRPVAMFAPLPRPLPVRFTFALAELRGTEP